MTNFKMPAFPAAKSKAENQLQMLFALGFLSEDVPGIKVGMAEQTFDERMPKFLIDGEEFTVNSENRFVALFFYGLYRATKKDRFCLTDSDKENFLDYCAVNLRDLVLNPRSHRLILAVLGEKSTVEVVVRQLADA